MREDSGRHREEAVSLLFEDAQLLVCIKPRGVLSAKDSSGKKSMDDLLAPRTVYPVHRLDRDTMGLMVFAKSKEAAALLSAQMGTSFAKEYLARCEGAPPEQGEFLDLLYHDRGKNKTYVVKRKRMGVKEARLSYEVLSRSEGSSLLRVQLFTGRTHQIRVQFASRGYPLLGDKKYGAKTGGDLQLWAYRLRFVHPKGETLDFTLADNFLL